MPSDADSSETVVERCGVCGGSTTNTALPVFDEEFRVCDKCQRGLWRALNRDGEMASEEMTVSELLALCGSANHDAGDKTLDDLFDVLGEAHPAVAGKLVEHQRRALDDSAGDDRGTASASEHPEWHDSLQRAKEASEERWPDE